MEKKRSVGVTVFGCIGLCGAILDVFWSLFNIQNLNLFLLFIGLIFIFLSYNLLRLKNWSRTLLLRVNIITAFAMTIVVVLILFILPIKDIIGEFKRRGYFLYTSILFSITFIYTCSFIYFFTRPKVKEQFKKEEIPSA